jgi:trk system potassium uptake protein TrkA
MKAILIGGGAPVYYLARSLAGRGYEVTIICDEAAEAARLARRLKAVVVVGDGSAPRVLEEAGVAEAALLLALTPRDEVNLVACQLARLIHGVPIVFALANDPDNEATFRALGVRAAFSPTRVLSALIESSTQTETIGNIYPSLGGQVNLTEILLPEGAPASGRPVREVRLPQGALLGALFRGDSAVIPKGATVLEAGDRLLLVSTPADYPAALRALVGNR